MCAFTHSLLGSFIKSWIRLIAYSEKEQVKDISLLGLALGQSTLTDTLEGLNEHQRQGGPPGAEHSEL